jgi:VCBS repeat-containing protein
LRRFHPGTDFIQLEDRLAPNQIPLAINDFFTIVEDDLLEAFAPGVLDNDSDPDNDPLTAELVDGPASGQLTFHADGSFTYTPEENFHGQVTFTYRAFDGTDWSEFATVTITINPVNDAPFAVDDDVATDEDTAVTFSVLANDFDVDGGSFGIVGHTNPSHGTLILNGDQTFTYTPSLDWSGQDSFTYTISDTSGATDTASVNVAVRQIGPAFDDMASTDEEQSVIISVLENDDGADLGAATLVLVGDPGHGSVEINEDDTVTYTPDTDWFGEDSFTYTMHDASSGETDTATVWLLIYPVNDPPQGIDDNWDLAEDSSLTFNVLANDIDVENPDLGALVDQPEHGKLAYELDGTVTYEPYADFSGTDEFTYLLFDDSGGEDTATVYVTVTPVNDVPIAYNDHYRMGSPANVPPPTLSVSAPAGLLRNDIDYDYQDTSYQYSLQVTSVVTPPGFQGSLSVNPDGSFEYTPPMNFFGTTSFTYRATDGLPQSTSEAATVWLIVNPLQPLPGGDPLPPVVARDDLFDFEADAESLSGRVLSNDDNATYAIVDAPPAYGRLIPFDGGGSFTYYPDQDQPGNPVPGVNLTPTGSVFTAAGLPYTAYASDDRAPSQALLKLQKQEQPVRVESIEMWQYWGERFYALEGNPSYPDDQYPDGVTPGGGKRVFPNLDQPADANAEARRTVWVKVILSGTNKRHQAPAIWAYDVDDPSSNQAPVDDENNADSQGRKYDNRSPFTPDPRWRRLDLWAASDQNGVVWVKLTVSMQPGDNYRIVASMTDAQQTGFYGPHPDPERKGRVFDATGQDVATRADVRVSELLTVWRRMHVELDQMDPPPSGEPFRGRREGNTGAVGDDDAHPNTLPKDLDITLMRSEYRRAYMEVLDDLKPLNPRTLVLWDHNMERFDQELVGRWQKDVPSQAPFWALHFVRAYEAWTLEDHDPNGERAQFGRAIVDTQPHGDGPSFIYVETIDDFQTYQHFPLGKDVDTATAIRRTVLHESMHHFEGLKSHTLPLPDPANNPADQGPMHPDNPSFGSAADNRITPAQRHLMRSDSIPGS